MQQFELINLRCVSLNKFSLLSDKHSGMALVKIAIDWIVAIVSYRDIAWSDSSLYPLRISLLTCKT